MGFLILGLFGTAFIGTVAFDWFDNDDSQGDHVDVAQAEEEGQDLHFDGSDTLEGSEGHDTLSTDQDNSLAPQQINLLGGDDTADIAYNDPITISGGAGDDTITASGVLNTLDGGDGDDVLTADDSNHLNGGDGDDILNFNHGSYDQGENGSADGGDGDDIITLRTDALVPDFLTTDVGGVDVRGGSGSDEFNIIYELSEEFDGGEGVVTGTDEDMIFAGDFISIGDFDPREDSLVIEVDRSAETTQAETTQRDVSVALEQIAEGDSYTSQITLSFAKTDTSAEATNILTVISAAPFTLDDIRLVGV